MSTKPVIKVSKDFEKRVILAGCNHNLLAEMTAKPKGYWDWFEENEEEIDIALCESGAWDEADFCYDLHCEKLYDEYLKKETACPQP